MTATLPAIEELLDPIPVAGMPAGIDMRWTPEWDRLKEARRFDDALEAGKWQKRERKTADWSSVHDLATMMLRERTKDLQISMWLTEADIKIFGFPGLRDGFRLTRELMERYWDAGLFPSLEDGPEDRSGPFEWLNNKLVEAIRAIPITARKDPGRDYHILDFEDARRTGSEKSFRSPDGDVDSVKKRVYDEALAAGRISLEMFDAAVRSTERDAFEQIAADFHDALKEFRALERLIEEKFGDVAPNLSQCRSAMDLIQQGLAEILEDRRKVFPVSVPAAPKDNASREKSEMSMEKTESGPMTIRLNLPITSGECSGAGGGSWSEAETMVRTGQVEKGLAEMARLAAGETTGRNRFQRKLLLAQICLETSRERIARSILEELAEQIDKYQLEQWESSDLIAGVWSRIIGLYKNSSDSDLTDRARKIHERLCRLDPWQALKCGEV